MKYLILILLMSSSFALSDIKEGDTLVVAKEFNVLPFDGQGILNIADAYQIVTDQDQVIEKGMTFEVVEVNEFVNSQTIQGKTINSCTRSIELYKEDCSLKQGYFEQILGGSPATEIKYFGDGPVCTLRISEKLDVFCNDISKLKKKSDLDSIFSVLK